MKKFHNDDNRNLAYTEPEMVYDASLIHPTLNTMLKSELILPRLKKRGDQITPLALPNDYHYLALANELIQLVKSHLGHTRGELEESLKIYEGDSLDYQIIRGLFNVLETRCVFSQFPAVNPVTVRTALFEKGPVTLTPDLLTTTTRWQVIADTAAQFHLTSQALEEAMFADLLEERIILNTGDPAPFSPTELIARYNLEVARGLLYWAREVRMTVHDTYKDLFKYIKLFKLMHTVYPLSSATGYQIILHGPISPFVNSTLRYGLQFAKFLPAILLCQNWQLEAEVQPPTSRRPLHYNLDDQTALRSHFKASPLFDSTLEADFAADFATKYTGAKRAWELTREDEVIVLGDTVMIPDFALTHRKDGRRALIEIIGFWHPEYLQRKLTKIRQANCSHLILLVYQSANVATGVFEAVSTGEVLTFNKKPILKEVLAAVERCAI